MGSKMLTSFEALRVIHEKIGPLPEERVNTVNSLGRVLAEDIVAPMDMPPFDKSAMDGYAVRGDDDCTEFAVIGEVQAGQIFRKRLKSGQAVKIMTGAVVPPEAGRVVMKEHVEPICADRIGVRVADERTNICRKGEDVKRGAKLYAAGQVITPVVLAGMACVGIARAKVIRRPRIGLLITGSELQRLGTRLKPAKIYNSNGPLLRALLARQGLEEVTEILSGDSFPSLKKAFQRLLACNDAIMISGGVSVGDYDLVDEVLQSCGCTIHFDQVAIQPGKPFTFATKGKTPIFAFPGNPASVFVSYALFAIPALWKMNCVDFTHELKEYVLKGEYSRRRAEREAFLPVKSAGGDAVELLDYHGSGDLIALSKASALMIVPAGVKEIKDGERVRVMPMPY